MKIFFIKLLLNVALRLLLKHTRVKDVLDLVNEAEEEMNNPFARRGYVYRRLKEREKGEASTGELNLVLEAGVNLYRLVKS